MNMKRFLSIFFVLPLVFVSCDLTMDEVSQDVNKPTQVHPKTILTQLCITTFGIEYYGVQPYRLAWQWDQRGGGGAVDDLPQRQQLCPGDVPHSVFVRLAHIHGYGLTGIQQTDGVCGGDLFCHTLTPQR